MSPKKDEITYGCAFCGQAAETPIAVYADWAWSDDREPDEQMWPAHRECFVGALCEQARVFSDEEPA